MTGKNDSKNTVPGTLTQKRPNRPKKTDPETRFYRLVSLGTILSGVLACIASVGIGMGLMLAGTMIFAEV